jgi:5-methylthioadenosine/S-adenosylhomocysteine deaminase
MNPQKISIENGILVTVDEQLGIIEKGHVLVEGDRIVKITKSENEIRRFEPDWRIEASRKIVLPGLINTHMHTRPQRMFADGLSMVDWHTRYADNFTKELTSEEAFLAAQLAFAECLKSGVTSVISMCVNTESDIKAAKTVGIRARINPLASTDDDIERNIKEVERWTKEHSNTDQRVALWLGLETPMWNSDSALKMLREAQDATGSWIHAHLSEDRRDDVERLKKIGFLNPRMVLAHCVKVTEEDTAILAERQVKVAHDPRSNMRFGHGVAPVISMLEKGMTVALGTDGGLNTVGRDDMFEEMRTVAWVHRAFNKNPAALSSEQVLRMCTVNGAISVGMPESGKLRAGAKADIVMLNTEPTIFSPLIVSGKHSNIVQMVVFVASSSNVDTVIVDGKVVVEKNRVLNVDESFLKNAVQKMAEKVISKLS